MSAPNLPTLASTDEPWGPPSSIPKFLKFNDVPYAPFSKGDKLGKVADWASEQKDTKDQRRQQHGRGHRDPYHAYGANSASFFTNEEPDNVSAFSVVDSTKSNAPKPPRTQNAVLKTRGGGSSSQRGSARGGRGGFRGGAVVNVGNSARHGGGRRHGWKDFDNNKKNREPSLKVQDDMKLLQTVNYSNLQKLFFDVQQGEEVGSYGYVNHYNKALEKTGSNLSLKPLERTVYNVTASDDPVIQDLASKKTGLVYATDTVIALLMTATKTSNPWDIVVNKKDGQIFLDKREDGPLDYVTVDENAADAPVDYSDKDSNINSATKLGLEATYINKNFTANAVATNQKFQLDKPNPFTSGDEPLLANGYRYKKYNLGATTENEPIDLVVRTQFDAVQPDAAGKSQFVSVQALNEYGGSNHTLEWKNKFANQRGAIVAAEMKNNLSKLSRWTVQSVLADVKSMKIGFVSRTSAKSNSSHVIVGVLGRDPKQFAAQLNVNVNNGWGIVKSVINIVSPLADGKYVLMKDPNMPQIHLYEVEGGKLEGE